MGESDDFITPSNVDLNTKCDENSNILSHTIILPLGAALSLLCCLYLLWMYFVVKSPILIRHPTSKCLYMHVILVYVTNPTVCALYSTGHL